MPYEPVAVHRALIVHPDVRRMLLTQKAYTEAARAFTCWVALQIDREHEHPTDVVRKDAEDLVALLRPSSRPSSPTTAQDPDEAAAAAVPYLRVIGHQVYSYLWARMAKLALARKDEDFYRSKLATARFYYAKLLPETASLIRQARAGAAPLMQLDAALF